MTLRISEYPKPKIPQENKIASLHKTDLLYTKNLTGN